ncbi:ABC transporter ATP-binding protein [Nocardioides cavernaquae]|uniref:ABC transporter ATP-binding protein n=1 Tax=Nocardioides cavernaquae TaxID=2321396 RepID=A0A3A5H8I1_9ACTN|nr:ATP-binding cassette domain-containing protein [Nocardioides cavernaquae]RJS45685.1 ABC transporter ATP-binding protein [Nocardioides cavernaquae]
MIRLADIRICHGARVLVDIEEVALTRGSAVTLVGESGSGKSLLAQALVGNLPHGLEVSGRLDIDGRVTRLDDLNARRALWGRRIVQLPQEPALALDPTMRVLGQVAEGHPRRARRRGRSDAHAAAHERLAAVGLPHVSRAWPHTLSGGMAQRVAFAAATVGDAPLLVADEPTKGLDPIAVDRLATLLEEHVAAGGALLTITHDLDLARRLGGQVLVMRRATVTESGPADQVLVNPGSPYTRRLIDAEPRHWDTAWPVPPEGQTLIRGTGLTKAYDGNTVLADLDVDLAAGERVALTGPSGAGKTTLGNVLAGLVRPDTGVVERSAALRSGGVQKLYQDPVLSFPQRQRLQSAFGDVLRRHRIDPTELDRLLGELGLDPSLLARRPGQVSGGELQRLAVIRALLVRPQVLLADEPTSRLDPITQEETVRALMDAVVARGIALLLVTHDPDLARKVCQRSIELGRQPSGPEPAAMC